MNTAERTGEGEHQVGNGEGKAPAPKKRTRGEARQAVADLIEGKAGPKRKADEQAELELDTEAERQARARARSPAEGQGEAEGAGKGKAPREGAGADGGDSGEAEGAGKGKVKPKTWKEAAERLGLDPEELYSLELELAANKGKATIGQIKDLLQQHGPELGELSSMMGSARKDQDAAASAREIAVAEANTVRRDLVGIMGAMGHVPEGVITKVRAAQTRRLERELALTLDAAPEWRDPGAFLKDKAEIASILKPYGFSAGELDAVDDSRLMLFLRDTLNRRRAARRALDGSGEGQDDVKRAASGPAGRGAFNQAKSAGYSARLAAAKAGGRESKTALVASLLGKKG